MNRIPKQFAAILILLVLVFIPGCKKSEAYRHLLSGGTEAEVKRAAATYCVHEITGLTPFKGNCPERYVVGDKVCIRCDNGTCPEPGRFVTDDGFILSACYVDTKLTEGSGATCKETWESGTCKSYGNVVKP
jgi:hypothetical protein